MSSPLSEVAEKLLRENPPKVALRKAQLSLSETESNFGPLHVRTAADVHTLAHLLQMQDKLPEAVVLFERYHFLAKRLFGIKHPRTRKIVSTLGDALYTLRKYEESEPYIRQSMEYFQENLGYGHSKTVESVHKLAEVLHDLGELKEAEHLYRRALKEYTNSLSVGHSTIKFLLLRLSDLLQATGQEARLHDELPVDFAFLATLEPLRRNMVDEAIEVFVFCMERRKPNSWAEQKLLANGYTVEEIAEARKRGRINADARVRRVEKSQRKAKKQMEREAKCKAYEEKQAELSKKSISGRLRRITGKPTKIQLPSYLNQATSEEEKEFRKPKNQLSADEISKYREAFELFDEDKSDATELENVMVTVGWCLTAPQIRNLLNEFDDNGDGVLDFGEFLKIIDYLRVQEEDSIISGEDTDSSDEDEDSEQVHEEKKDKAKNRFGRFNFGKKANNLRTKNSRRNTFFNKLTGVINRPKQVVKLPEKTTKDFPEVDTIGISLAILQRLASIVPEGMTSGELILYIIQPETKEKQRSFLREIWNLQQNKIKVNNNTKKTRLSTQSKTNEDERKNNIADARRSFKWSMCIDETRSLIGTSTHYVCHSLSSSFSEMVDALTNFEKQWKSGEIEGGGRKNDPRTGKNIEAPPIYYWIDIFSVDQNFYKTEGKVGNQLPDDFFSSQKLSNSMGVDEAKKNDNRATIVMIPGEWNDIKPLNSLFCLWSIYVAMTRDIPESGKCHNTKENPLTIQDKYSQDTSSGKIYLAFTKQQHFNLREAMLSDFDSVLLSFSSIDCENAISSSTKERQDILLNVELDGIGNLNKVTENAMLHWLAEHGLRESEILEEHRGSKNDGLQLLRLGLSTLLCQIGRHEDASPLLRSVAQAREKVIGLTNAKTLDVMDAFAKNLKDLGEFEESEAVYWRLLNAREFSNGSDAVSTLMCTIHLADLLRMRQKLAPAHKLYSKALQGYENIAGKNARSTQECRERLKLLERHASAEKVISLHRHELAKFERTCGPNHQDTLGKVAQLVHSLIATERLDEAEKLIIERILPGWIPKWSISHPKCRRIIRQLAKICHIRGEIKRAKALYASLGCEDIICEQNVTFAKEILSGLSRYKQGDSLLEIRNHGSNKQLKIYLANRGVSCDEIDEAERRIKVEDDELHIEGK